MGTIQKRWLLSALSTAVCGALAWAWIASRPARDSIRLVDDWPATEELLLQRQRKGAPVPSQASADAPAGRLVREPIDPDQAHLMWPTDPALHVYDPQVYYRYKGGLDLDLDPNKDGGKFHLHTSAEGYREDYDHLPEHRDFFVVVTGDSHTDGVCENRQTFASRLEVRLAEQHPGKAVAVVNTGVSGYSFYHYLGSLERHLDLHPDAFVVGIYGGNDFLGVLKPWHFFHHTVPPPRSREYWKKLSTAQGISSSLLGNAFNQLLYFQYNPDQMDVALEAADEVCAEIVRLCRERKIAPFFVYIPPGIGRKGGRKPEFEKTLAALELSEADFAQFDTLADHLIGRLKGLGAEVIDLREHFTGDINQYYWSDLHINVKAHERIAEVLVPRVEAVCFAQH